jgi:hypothetical protein
MRAGDELRVKKCPLGVGGYAPQAPIQNSLDLDGEDRRASRARRLKKARAEGDAVPPPSQGLKLTGVHGRMGAWAHGRMGAWAHGCMHGLTHSHSSRAAGITTSWDPADGSSDTGECVQS